MVVLSRNSRVFIRDSSLKGRDASSCQTPLAPKLRGQDRLAVDTHLKLLAPRVGERRDPQFAPIHIARDPPLYTVATFMLARATGLEFLRPMPQVFFFAALFAWALTFFGMLRSWRGFFTRDA